MTLVTPKIQRTHKRKKKHTQIHMHLKPSAYHPQDRKNNYNKNLVKVTLFSNGVILIY